MPGGRRRNDARQGTIDQDLEFKEFLESLTAPITKPAAPEGEVQKEEKVKTTPLIEALREKKANKDKPQAKGKQGRGEAKDDAAEKKTLGKGGKEAALASGDKNRRLNKAEREKAQKDAVKVLNKEASALKDASAMGSTDKAAPATQSPATERKRGNVNLAKSMLQRDLGIGPAPNRRRGTKREVTPATQDTLAQQDENTAGKQKAKDITPVSATTPSAADKTASASTKKERPSRAERRAFKASLADKTNSRDDSKAQTKPAPTPAPTILKKPQSAQPQTPTAPKGPAAARAPPTEPAAARNPTLQPQATPSKADATSPARPANPTPSSALPAPTPTGKQAFLKHANASQGITEPLIEEALKVFGAIEKVEIDKRKGFAYVDFAEPEGLQNAIAASPVKVAQGAVQVLERKEKVARNRPFAGPPTGPARGRGGFGPRGRGRGGARGGGHAIPNLTLGDPAPASAAAPAPAPAPAASAPATSEAAT